MTAGPPRLDPVLQTERMVLRRARVGDADQVAVHLLRNREHLAPWEPKRVPAHFTREFWVSQLTNDLEHQNLRLFLFPKASPDRIIGSVHLTQFVGGAAQHCTLGYHLGASSEGQGYMTEALRSALGHVFATLTVHRILANYMPHNHRSGAVLNRLGFIVEGYARASLLIDGRWEDHVLASLMNPNDRVPGLGQPVSTVP